MRNVLLFGPQHDKQAFWPPDLQWNGPSESHDVKSHKQPNALTGPRTPATAQNIGTSLINKTTTNQQYLPPIAIFIKFMCSFISRRSMQQDLTYRAPMQSLNRMLVRVPFLGTSVSYCGDWKMGRHKLCVGLSFARGSACP